MNLLSLFPLIPLADDAGTLAPEVHAGTRRDGDRCGGAAGAGRGAGREVPGPRQAGATAAMLFTDSHVWYAPLNIHYSVGVDGISVAMLLLSAIIVFTGTFASWRMQELAKEYFLWFTLLSVGVFGFFISVDLFTMFLFYEVALIPMYLLIGVWGQRPQGVLRHEADTDADGRFRLPAYRYPGYLLRRRCHLDEPIGNSTDAQYSHRAATYLVPAHLPRFRCAGRSVPVPHVEPRRSRLGTDCRIHAPCRCIDETGRLRMLPHSHVPDARSCTRTGMDIPDSDRTISVVYGAFSACVQTDLKYINAYSSVSHCGLVLFAILMMNQTAARALCCRC